MNWVPLHKAIEKLMPEKITRIIRYNLKVILFM